MFIFVILSEVEESENEGERHNVIIKQLYGGT